MKKKYSIWLVLLGLTLIYFSSNGYGYLSIPTFYPSLTEYFKLPKGEVPKTASILTFIIALLSPIAGYLLDRFKPKNILLIGVIGLALMQIFFSKIQTLNDFRLFNIGYAVMLSLGGFVTSVFILNKWFDKHRGIAMGIFLNASSLGAAFFSSFIGKELKSGTNWQQIASNISIYTSILLILPILIIKNPPKNSFENSAKEPIFEHKSALIEYFKTSKFWLILLATGFVWFCINSFLFHKDSFLSDLNLAPNERGKFSQIFFICGVFGKLSFGYLSDKFAKRQMMLVSIICLLLGIILMKVAQTQTQIVPLIAIAFGIGYSGAFTMIQLMIAENYSGVHFGKILGIFIMADTLFGALGTFILGNLRTTTGNYNLGINLMICISILAFFFIFFTKKTHILPK